MKPVLLLLTLVAALASGETKRISDEFQTANGPVKITPIRHASALIEAGGQVVYIDPTGEGDYQGLPVADLILLTDIHQDHLNPAGLARVRKPTTVVVGPDAVAKSVDGATMMRNGESHAFGPWNVEAIAAYNIVRGPAPGKTYHDKGRGNGYVLTFGGKRFYFSGDTEGVPEVKSLRNIEAAYVCMNLPYTMTPEEAAEAVRAFKPRVAIPYHYRGSDLAAFEKALAGSGVEVRVRDWYY